MKNPYSIALLALLATALACGKSKPSLNTDQPPVAGLASWYGKREQGRRMANGQRFDRNKLTCASRTYRLGTVLLVSYPKKGTFVVVTVTDRGPFKRGRILDLSEHAARTLGLKPQGVGRVMIAPVRFQWFSDGHNS